MPAKKNLTWESITCNRRCLGKYFQMLADIGPASPPQAGVGGRENEADTGQGEGVRVASWDLGTLAKPLSLERRNSGQRSEVSCPGSHSKSQRQGLNLG